MRPIIVAAVAGATIMFGAGEAEREFTVFGW